MPAVRLTKPQMGKSNTSKGYTKIIRDLNDEIDQLARQNQTLSENLSLYEKRISSEYHKESELEKQNKSLIDELCRVNKENVTAKADFRHQLDTLIADNNRLHMELAQAINKQNAIQMQAKQIEQEKATLERSLSETDRGKPNRENDARAMRNLVLRLEEDKKRLAQRIEKLTANERALVLELERVKRHGGFSSSKTKSISRLEEHLAGIEADRDYWRNQVELLQQMLAHPSLAPRSNSTSRVSSRLKSKPPSGQTKTTSKAKETPLQHKLEQQISELRADRDRLRMELDRSSRSRVHSPQPLTRSRSLNRLQNREDLLELTRLRQERDDLRRLLNKLEVQVQEIQKNVHTLTMERDQVNKLYNDARCEIQRLHQDLYALHENGDRVSYTSQTVLRRAESERDRALVDLSRVTAERDSLITKYKNATETAMTDKLRLTKQLDQLERNLKQVSMERDDAVRRSCESRQRVDELHSRHSQLEETMNERQELFKKANDEVNQLRNEVDVQQRIIEEKTEEAIQLGERLRVMELEVRRVRERGEESEKRLRLERDETVRLHNQLDQLHEENKNLQYETEKGNVERAELLKQQRHIDKRIQAMNVDCDRLTRQLDEANTRNAQLEEKIKQLEKDGVEQLGKYHVEKANSEKIQERLDAVVFSKNTAERRLAWSEQQLAESQNAASQLEAQLSAERDRNKWLTEANEKLTEDSRTLRATVELANKDKVHLESCIEDLTASNRQAARDRDEISQRFVTARERVVELEDCLKQAEQELKRNAEALRMERASCADFQQQLEITRRRADVAERDLAELGLRSHEAEDQLHKAETRVVQLERELRAEREDYKQLRTRLEACDEEKQATEDVSEEREELKQRVKDYLNELTRQERVVGERDSECTKLTDQLRLANEEAESWHSRWENTESKLSNIRVELDEREAELTCEKERADAREREISHLRTSLNSAEMQGSSATRAAAEASEQLQIARAEIETLTTEISRLRDSLVRMETEKSNAQREASGHRLDSDQLRAQLDDLELELEQLKDELEQERATNRGLQTTLQSSRQKEQNAVLEIQEKTAEVTALRDRITTVDERSDVMQRESERLRERLAESEREINRLSRSLSAERFEKERALSELRLSSLPVGYRPSGYSGYANGLYQSSTLPRDRPSVYRDRDLDY
ncbi:hypothetical protein FBUS_05513 [Fasciolopsis buskii]|uniref:Centrosomal protein of 135 kDa n=1 Tax=Fasciolopsis buskii TaxID=27845 RepID=A0A8E0RZY6_9TREM|nr:hypothetical protein FBUS_05513 [Fasciolopsis buski]